MSKESGGAPPELQELRQKIDEVDEGIVRLIARRLEMVGLVIKEKSGRPQPIRDPARERLVLARVESVAQSLGVSGPLARKIFSEIITHSLAREAASLSSDPSTGREVAIAYQGSPTTYNHLAAEKFAGERGFRGRFLACASHKEVIDQLESGAADLAFLPIENTAAGSINQVYDLLREHDFHIVGEETFKVEHCLAATAEVPLEALHQILSHPLALDQCTAFIDGLPQAHAVPCVDTAEALRLVADAKDETQAAIGSPEAAAAHGLTILRRNIGDHEEIHMRYVALARAPESYDPRIACKTSLIITTRHEQGALLRCLQLLSDYGLSRAEGPGGGLGGGPMKIRVRMRGADLGGAPQGTPELYFGDPDGIVVQLQDPSYCGGGGPLGAVCSAVEPAKSKGLIGVRDLSHFTVFISDAKRSNAFYQQLFGFSIRSYQGPTAPTLAVGPGVAFLMFAGVAGGRGGAGTAPLSPSINHLCLSMDGFDVDRVLKHLESYGIKPRENAQGPVGPLRSYVTMRTENRGGAKEGTPELYLTDPDGILLQIQDARYCGGAGVLGDKC